MCFSLPASIRPSILTRDPPFFPFHLLLPSFPLYPSVFIPLQARFQKTQNNTSVSHFLTETRITVTSLHKNPIPIQETQISHKKHRSYGGARFLNLIQRYIEAFTRITL
ncbi:hypothetical protein Hdeb2414_s0027g00685211 [Helianthus debilis subsp. tardiflorus]